MSVKRVDWGAVGAIGTILAVAVGWLLESSAAGLPAWPAYLLVPVTFAALLAALLRWPPFRAEPATVADKHAKQLRKIARGLRDEIAADEIPTYTAGGDRDLAQSMFAAHFPDIHAEIGRFSQALADWRAAMARFLNEAGVVKARSFDRLDGWDGDQLAAAFRAHRHAIVEGRDPELRETDREILWDGRVIYTTPHPPSIDRFVDLTNADDAVRRWVAAAGASKHAERYRASRPRSRESASIALPALEQIIEHQSLRVARNCPICTPRQQARRRTRLA
jgi:hypothetical protein